MKIIIYITVLLLTFTAITFSQSVMNFPAGSALTLDSGSDISADVIIINGTYSGGGTINGSVAYVLNLTAFIEGFYNSSADIMVSDTVRVYLRNLSSPYAIVDTAKAVLDETGVGTFIFSNVSNATNYYVVITHRNSIETWSAAGTNFTSFSMLYDFSSASSQAYGSNMSEIDASPVRFGIYSGDVNQDGIIDVSDGTLIDNDAYNFVSGYAATDCNGDNIVDVSDQALEDNNAYNFVSKVTP